MASEIRKLGKHTLVYGAGLVVSKLAGFLMLPIYTRFLTPADYGVLELLTTTVDLIGTITSLGLASAVFKFYSEQSGMAGKQLVVSTSEWALGSLALVTSLAGIASAPLLAEPILGEGGRALYFRLFFVIYFFQTAENVPLLYLRARERSLQFVAFSVGKLVLMLGLNIWLVAFERMGVLGVLTGNLIANGVIATLLVGYTFRDVGTGFSPGLARTMAAFGVPLVFWGLGNFVLVFFDRYFLKHYAGTAAVGIYSLAYRFAAVLTALGFRPFFMMWGPQRFEVAQRDDAEAIFPRVFAYMNVVLGTVGLLIVLFVDEVVTVMADPAFHPAYRLVPLLIAAQIVYHWVPFSNLGLYLEDRSGLMGGLGALSAAVMLGLLFLLVPRFGVFGAAWATLLAYVFRYGVILAAAQREYEIDHDWVRVIRLYAVLGAGWLVHELVTPASLSLSTALSVLLATVALITIYRWLLSERERALARETLSRGIGFVAAIGDSIRRR